MIKSMLGYCLKGEKGQLPIHVCSYLNDKIQIQQQAGDKPKSYTLYEDKKGHFFRLKGKKIYLNYIQ